MKTLVQQIRELVDDRGVIYNDKRKTLRRVAVKYGSKYLYRKLLKQFGGKLARSKHLGRPITYWFKYLEI